MSEASGQVDLGALVLDEGYFLLRQPAVARMPFLGGDEPPGSCQHVFTYAESPQAIKEAAIDVIDSAREKVFVASFLLGDTDLLDALYRAVGRLCGGVYVVSALDEKSLRRGLAETESDDDPDAADKRAHSKRFEDMTQRGIAVRGHENCHAKFIVADDRRALVSSANLVTRAFGITGENGALISDPAEAGRLGRFFARLWSSCTYEMPPGEAHTVQQRDPSDSPCAVPVPPVGPGTGLIWTYPGENVILATLHDIIARAERTLLLATFGLTGLTDHPELLTAPLERAIRERGVKVTMLVRSRNNMAGHRGDAATLAALGVTIYADLLNHAKGAIADEAYGALFSANFDAAHGLNSGVEVGIRLDGTPALQEAVRYFQHAMIYSDQLFDPRPAQASLDLALDAKWRKPWPLESPVRVRATASCWQAFSESANPPVLYLQSAKGQIDLLAGTSRFRLGAPDSSGIRDLTPPVGPGRSAARELGDWLSRRPQPGSPAAVSVARGFCPAVIEHVNE
jgi:phosphatidylserine/phosphatidylglycerophosphate/cardiolipin synthase-like enzyme